MVEKEQLFDEFADQVFKLKENEFSKLIKTDIGWHILKVTEIIKSKSKKLSEVKNTIKEDIVLTKSYDELDIVLNEVEDEITNGADLEEVSNKLNLDLINVKLLEKKSFFKYFDHPNFDAASIAILIFKGPNKFSSLGNILSSKTCLLGIFRMACKIKCFATWVGG